MYVCLSDLIEFDLESILLNMNRCVFCIPYYWQSYVLTFYFHNSIIDTKRIIRAFSLEVPCRV